MRLYDTFCYYKHIFVPKTLQFRPFLYYKQKKSRFFVVIKKYLLNSHLINNK